MNYVVKRLARAGFTVFVVISLTFGMIRLLPGGPMDFLRAQMIQRGGEMSMQEINKRIAAQTNIEVNEPLYVQYVDYMANILTGDFGTSIWHDQPVTAILGEAIPWTVFMMATSLFLGFVIGISLGAFMAYREGSTFDVGSSTLSLILNSTPSFVVALLLLTFLGHRLSLFPTGGRYASATTPGLNVPFLLSALHHAALPILSLSIVAFGGWALDMRGNSIRILGEDYLRVARLRGLPERRIALRYVARNAILPMYTGFLLLLGFRLGGTVILEQIFSYTGLGYYLFASLKANDYPLMMGTFLVITVALIVGVYVADLTYSKIDPRISAGGSDEAY